jgi:phenylpyruvate tautomerase PptA (4-oxalocrotonate tautomerase family)
MEMPMVRIEWRQGRSDETKSSIARQIVDVLEKTASISPSSTQVLFVDCDPNDWFEGHKSVAELIRGEK